MKNLIILLFITQALLLSSITVEHVPVGSIDRDRSLTVELEILSGFSEIDQVQIFYKSWEEVAFRSEELTDASVTYPVYEYTFTQLTDIHSGLEYYFLITDKAGLEQTLPEISPELNSFRVSIVQPVLVDGAFILLSPDPDYVSEGAAAIAISFFSLKDYIKPGSLKFLLDGKDITDKVKITNNLILYQHRQAKPGLHTYQAQAVSLSGSSIASPIWKHTVPGQMIRREFKYSGDAIFTSRLRRTENAGEETEDDNHSLRLNLKGIYRKLKMHSRLYLSSREDPDEQAVNRYSIKLAVPHLEFIGGDHTAYFGNYVASGINSRGIHANVLFNGFRFYSSYGQVYRSVAGKSDSSYANYDTYSAGTFQRNSLALRLEIGSNRSFQFALSASKTKDKESSLKEKYYISPADEQPFATPKDNLVFSSDLRLALLQQRLVFGAEWAMSLYNDNIIGGAIDKDSLEADLGEDIPFDPASLEDLFIINKNVSPIIPGTSNSAYYLYLKWNHKTNLLNVSYSAVGSSFNSLAVNYLSSDTSVLSIFDNLALMQNRLLLSLGVNLISDNVYDEKTTTSRSTNIFSQVMYRPVGLPYFSLSYSNNNSSNDADEEDEDDEDDTLSELDLRNNNITFNTGYYVSSINFAPTLFTLSFSNNIYSDEAEDSFEYSRSNFTLSARSDLRNYPVKTLLSYTMALNKNVTETYDLSRADEETKTTYHSLFFRSKFAFRDDTIKPYADLRYSVETGDLQQTSILGNVGLVAELYRSLTLKTSFGTAVYENEEEDDNSTTLNFKLKLVYNF